jgi:small ligand-binding sensory domain FIST
MKFVSALVTDPEQVRDAAEVARLLAAQVRNQLEGEESDIHLAVVFLSSHYAPKARLLAEELRRILNIGTLIGCSAEGVIATDQEIERAPAISLIAAQLPGVEVTPFQLHVSEVQNWSDLLDNTLTFRKTLGVQNVPKLFILLADPFSTPIDPLLAAFNAYYIGAPVMGGMASSAQYAGANALILGNEVGTEVRSFGAVGVALAGDIDVDVVVSQGCRPIGQTYKVTSTSEDMIFSLNGGSPLKQVQEMVNELDEADHALLNNGLYVGRAVRRPTPGNTDDVLGRGDFLIRGVRGVDQRSGALAIGDFLEDGELVQFHLRDAKTAEEDLELMLTPQAFFEPPAGAILFSCNGRGTRLFDHPNGDVKIIQNALGSEHLIPLTGFFCGGEIGPIGGRNFLHGHTASLVLFRPAA